MSWTQGEWNAHVNAEMREREAAEARGRKDTLRERQVALVEFGLHEGVRRAPDVFPTSVNWRAVAERVVDEML
jgi:hypothetical protein